MLPDKENKRISKFMSYVLRHKPETIGLTLDENGWTDVDQLIAQLSQNGFAINAEILDFVVTSNSKKRFAFNEDKTQIRASQGHSLAIDLALEPATPPPLLYHGTATQHVMSILKTGLEKQGRQHVHLSKDLASAIQVGGRHGKPIVLNVDAARMHKDGFVFYLSANEVWLTEHVPVIYLEVDDKR